MYGQGIRIANPAVKKNKPKVLGCKAEGLNQKVGGPGAEMNSYSAADVAVTGGQARPNPSGCKCGTR
jgi:hypothetical protein